MSRAIARVIYRWRLVLSAAIVLGAIVLLPRANLTRIDNELTAWFSREDPVYKEYERFRDEFGGTRNLIVAVQAPSRERLLSPEGFAYIERVTGDIERVEAVERVNSLATATLVDGRGAGSDDLVLDVRRLTKDLETRSPAEVGQRAIDDELLRGDLISADGTVAALIVFFDERKIDPIRAAVLARIRTLVAQGLPDGYQTYYNGSLEISETYNRITLANQTKFTPPIALLTLVALYVLFRSWRYTLVTAFAVFVSAVWTLALYDLAGFSFNVLSSMIVPLVIVLAIADDVHIVQHYGEARRAGSAEHAFTTTVSHLFAPILGASGTTALGMATLATSQVVAVREFGLGAAIGVMVDFALSIILVPTLLGFLKPETRPAPQERWLRQPLERLAMWTTAHARLIAVVAVVLTLVGIAGLARLRVDTNHMNFFHRSHPISQAATVMDEKLAGIYTFQIMLEGPPDSIRQPDTLQRMDALEEQLRKLPFVRKVTGLSDYVRRIHRELGPDRTATVPGDPAVVAQELFVFTLGGEGRAELERIVASDYSRAQITIKLASMSSDLVFEQIEVAERIGRDVFAGSEVRTTVTGSGRLFAMLDHYLVLSQITSFSTAFVTVFGVIFLVFRSWRFGLLAVLPNLFPVLAVFGVMGWLDISLNVATVMLASVALGVVDDDTIHFISRYRLETRQGRTAREAIRLATAHEGRAALTTAVINSAAFGVLALSEYRPTAWFGGLLALTMGVAFLAEIFILPAAITLLPRLFGPDRVHAPRDAARAETA